MKQIQFSATGHKTSLRMPLLSVVILIMVLLISVSSIAKEKPSQNVSTTLLIWGDSLSAAYGIPIDKGWVQLLQNESPALNIINGSNSGETTQGG